MSSINHAVPAAYGLLPTASTVQQCATLSPFASAAETGNTSPPASSCSTGTALGSGNGSRSAGSTPANSEGNNNAHRHAAQHQPQQGVASMMAGHAGSAAGTLSGTYCASREWLYKLVTFPAYFTPCATCCTGCRTPKREQLMTLFDTKFPHKVFCSHCPECQIQGSNLLQVRRASFKDVVKATDIVRFGADIVGVQQYTLNGSKVIYLNREAASEKKPSNGSTAPAMCTVDGRAMMDKCSLYCSLKCKMQAEDAGFTNWLDSQDPAVRIMADIAANAPPRPTVACKRNAAQPTSSGSSGGSAATESGSGGSSSGVLALGPRPKKLQRTASSGGTIGAAAGAPAGQGTGDESAAPAGPRAAKQRAAVAMQRATSALQGPPAGLKPIKTNVNGAGGNQGAAVVGNSNRPLPLQGKMQHQQQSLLLPASMTNAACRTASAPSAFLEAAMAEPQLGPSTLQYGGSTTEPLQIPAPVGMSGSSWLAGPCELDNALSCSGGNIGSWESWGSWESGISSPAFALGVNDAWEDGSLSPALINAPATAATAFGGAAATGLGQLGGGLEDWWLPGSPTTGFATAGLAGF